MNIISAAEARRRAASLDNRYMSQINKEIKSAADNGEYSCCVHLDDIYTDKSAADYRRMLKEAGYTCDVSKELHEYVDDSVYHDMHAYYTTVITIVWK